MRVVQVNYAFDPGLKTPDDLLIRYTTLTGWADALAKAGAEVLTVQQFHSSANVTRYGLPYEFGPLDAIAPAVAAFRPHVVHVNGLIFPVQTWALRRALAPFVPAIVVQDHAGGPPPGWRAHAYRRLYRTVNAFLLSTEAHARPWRDAGIIGPEQQVYDVMEASTSIRALDMDEARSVSGVTGDPAVVWIGRLNANKDPLTVLDAFERFASTHESATLTMIFHERDLLDDVRERVAVSSRLRECVRLAGEVPHDRIAAFLSAADLFVVGSHHEGSGYALLEALACGATPVVTDIPSFRALMTTDIRPTSDKRPTNVGRLSEVRETYVGRLWTAGDADACARALASASRFRDRQRVIDHFERFLTWDAVGRRAVEIYREVIREKGIGIRE
jgi:glycosyltransferase involved in cell wall biosynthesis